MPTKDQGQAAVEAALTLPLLVFLALGTLQLFLMLQARYLAEYGVFRAVRAGSLNHGDCKAMKHAAVLAVLPALARTNDPASVEAAFKRHANNQYDNVRRMPGPNGARAHRGQIIELWRDVYFGRTKEVFLSTASLPDPEDQLFDQPDHLMRLETRMIFWYRLSIPFADWVMGRMFLAHYRLTHYDFANPLAPVEGHAGWPDSPAITFLGEPWPGGPLDQSMLAFANDGHYLFPIRVTWSMRMMTPMKKKFFDDWGCAL